MWTTRRACRPCLLPLSTTYSPWWTSNNNVSGASTTRTSPTWTTTAHQKRGDLFFSANTIATTTNTTTTTTTISGRVQSFLTSHRNFASSAFAAQDSQQHQQQKKQPQNDVPPLVLYHWQRLVRNNQLQADASQERAAKKLSKLQRALDGYDNGPWIEHYEQQQQQQQQRAEARRKQQEEQEEANDKNDQESDESAKNQVESSGSPSLPLEESEPQAPRWRVPRGLYLYGSVGTGKSLLMDTFFQLATVTRKRRCHFHQFMAQDVHERIHQLKQDDLQRHGRNFHVDTAQDRNPIYRVGRQIASETALLCLDEFQVTDVADALILSQLFSVLFALGTVVVSTSNRPPQDLYEGGLNRSYFMPFIDLLQKHCIVHDMASVTDYRKETSLKFPSYYFTAGNENSSGGVSRSQIDALVQEIRGDIVPTMTTELKLGHNRSLLLRDADERGKVVRVSFDELCNRDLGATDYRRLAYQYQRVVLEDIPILTTEQHDLARRFITLVDELYEGRCAMICVARNATATDPSRLFSRIIRPVNTTDNVDDQDTDSTAAPGKGESNEMLGVDQAMTQGGLAVSALASVRELDFAFARAASRLTEMTSLGWWDRVLGDSSSPSSEQQQ